MDLQGVYTADFETTTDPEDCRVWAWGLCRLADNRTFAGYTIQTFLRFCSTKGVALAWFHNLAFDGKFIIDYLLKHGYTHTTARSPYNGQFTTLVSNTNKFYQIQIGFTNGHRLKIQDSLKTFPMPIRRLAQAYDMPMQKGELDYKAYRAPGHVLTDEELAYLENDILIPAAALRHNYDQGMERMTAGANAFEDFKQRFGKKRFKRVFPVIETETDTALRAGYRGGFTWVKPEWAGRDTGEGISVDYNSMYPSQMLLNPFPVGKPNVFEGRYSHNPAYPLYVQKLTCQFRVKPDGVPMLQVKGTGLYGLHEYVTATVEPVQMTLTCVDLELMFANYDVDVLSYDGGWAFCERVGLFDEYINHWAEVKKNSTGALRQLAKLMLNSLYGKFGTNPDVTQKVPRLEDNLVKWETGELETRAPVYLPVAMFATAYARRALIDGIHANWERFVYCDTDSMHLTDTKPPRGIRLHESEFGAWKVEGTFVRSRHLRAKAYVLDDGERLTVSCAGMPDNVKELVTFENFKYGFSNTDAQGNVIPGHGKLRPKAVPGGVVLVDSPYVLKE